MLLKYIIFHNYYNHLYLDLIYLQKINYYLEY